MHRGRQKSVPEVRRYRQCIKIQGSIFNKQKLSGAVSVRKMSCGSFLFLLYRKFLKSSEIVYNRLEIKNDIAKERRGLRHDVVYEVFCFGLG